MNRYHYTDKPHCHWLDGKPLFGTTTVCGVIGKTLTWWASGQAVGAMGWLSKNKDKDGDIPDGDKGRLAARHNERLITAGAKLTDIKLMDVKGYLKLLDSAYRAHKDRLDSRAEEGTDLHSVAESYIRFNMDGLVFGKSMCLAEDWEKLSPFMDWAAKNIKRFFFSEACCYSEKLWTGGKMDFGVELFSGLKLLSDFKSRETAYFGDFVQGGGYVEQIAENGVFDVGGNRLFDPMTFDGIAVFPLTEKFKEPVIRTDVQRWRDTFKSTVGLYRSKNLWDKEHGEWK